MFELLPVVISGQGDALQDGDAEGERLAGARAGLAYEIGALNGNRDGHGLDGEGRDDPHPLQRWQMSSRTPRSAKEVEMETVVSVSVLASSCVGPSRPCVILRSRSS